MDIMVEAMPVAVYCTARREKETPRKGPKNAPRAILDKAFGCLNDFAARGHNLITVKMTEKPAIPAMTLI